MERKNRRSIIHSSFINYRKMIFLAMGLRQAVLVIITIPIFTTQLEKSRQSTDLANLRAAYAEAMVDALDKGADGSATSVAMVHTGTLDKVDSAKVGDQDVSTLSVTKGKTVTVAIDYDTDPVTVTFTPAS